jgi:DNA modification methylase
MKIDLRLGDCLEVLKTIPDNSIDSVVTDPPYGLGFMNKEWDSPEKLRQLTQRESDRSAERKAEGKSPTDAPFSKSVPPGLAIKGAREGKWFQEWCELWAVECLRILKPGGHILSFSAPRTYHRMATAFEDAGFEIRDQLMWVFAQGFPKSHNISKSLIKLADAKERTEQEAEHNLRCMSNPDIQETKSIFEEQGNTLLYSVSEQSISSSGKTTDTIWREESILEGRNNIQETEGELQGSEIHKMSERVFGDGEERWIHNGTQISYGETSKQIIDENGSSPSHRSQSIKQSNRKSDVISEQLTSQEIREIARTFYNYGTALKPAHEPIVMARKPLTEKSIAENVLKYGTGGINIDGSRIEIGDEKVPRLNVAYEHKANNNFGGGDDGRFGTTTMSQDGVSGRFPANIIFECICDELIDGKEIKGNENYNWNNTDTESNTFTNRGTYTPRTETPKIHTNPNCPCYMLDEQSGISKSSKHKWEGDNNAPIYGKYEKGIREATYDDKGGASRFFYCPKAAKKDRNEGLDDEPTKIKNRVNSGGLENDPKWGPVETKNNHPTVKPTDLMRYLINLITPPNGTTLDPFMGSGSTGKAAVRCGVNFIGIEKEQEYMDIASARIQHEQNKPLQTKLF